MRTVIFMKELQRHIYLIKDLVSRFSRKTFYALRDITEKLLARYEHSLWQDVNIQTLQNLRNLIHEATQQSNSNHHTTISGIGK
jgi:cobalamin biosynthesis Mg chelatase CobN